MSHTEHITKMEAGLAEKGIPVSALCKQAGIAQTTWGRWKRAEYFPSFRSWRSVEDAYKALIEQEAEQQGAAT